MSLVEVEKQVPVLEKQKLSSVIRGLIGKFKVGKHILYNSADHSFCILGALGFAGGMTRDEIGYSGYDKIKKIYPELKDEIQVNSEFSTSLCNRLFTWNDNGVSWNEIADKLEEVGY